MAWIESHQDLRTNPKAKRLARQLDVPLAQAIGHLHMLWWWALDHAFEGDLHRFDAYDVADAAGWDGNADTFVHALITCGPRGASGFLDGDPNDNATWTLHDWHEFTDAMRSKREASEKAHHTRWHKNRHEQVPGCRFCDADAMPPQSDRKQSADADDVRSQCAAPQSAYAPEPGPTGTNPTPPRTRDDDLELPPPPAKPKGGGDQIEDPLQHPVVTDLPAKHQRAIANDTPQARGRLTAAINRTNGIRTTKLKQTWDNPTALDDQSIKSIALTLATRITNLADQEANR